MELVNCNLCGSSDYRKVYAKPDHLFFKDEWFTVVECCNCGLGFVNPRPTFEEIARYYPKDYYEYDPNQLRFKIEGEYLREMFPDATGRLLLDVGCANGEFPGYMRTLGWQSEGVEVSGNSKTMAELKVYREEFPRIDVNEARYDAVTAWAVLEHVHDPMAYFKKTYEVLKPGGIFVFMMPNFGSISSRNLFLEDVPRHLYFFKESTVRKYLSHVGLTLLKADYDDNVFKMSPVNWLHYYVHRFLKRREFEWKDIPKTKTEYLEERQLPSTLSSNLKYIIANPLVAFDRALMPLFEQYQKVAKKYGSVTYVASKHS